MEGVDGDDVDIRWEVRVEGFTFGFFDRGLTGDDGAYLGGWACVSMILLDRKPTIGTGSVLGHDALDELRLDRVDDEVASP